MLRSKLFLIVMVLSVFSCGSTKESSNGSSDVNVTYMLDANIAYQTTNNLKEVPKSLLKKIEKKLGHPFLITSFEEEEKNFYNKLLFYKSSKDYRILCLRSLSGFTTNDWYFHDKTTNNLMVVSSSPSVDDFEKMKSCMELDNCIMNTYNL